MGAGGGSISSVFQSKKEEQDHLLRRRAPHSKPPFTLSQIKKAIPPHCFNRSVLRSFSYVVYDITIASILYYLATTYIPLLPSDDHMISANFIAWTIYGAVQGCVLTGVWVIAHECGHHAFSDYQLLNDIVGLVLHSALLVPYFSFKYSHRRHHSSNGSLERDEVFVPKPKSELSWLIKYLNNPPGRVLGLATTLICGWPSYLAFNVSGRHYERFASHFDPHGPIFSDRERLQIYLSYAGFLTTVYVLYRLVALKGLAWVAWVAWVACVYGFPLLVQNAFVVLITYLQHTHLALPHYDSSEWDFLRGALVTMDRDYGVLNKVFHNITDTHVAHHLFSTIPHYHAMEAMKAIKPVLGDYYQFDGTSIYKALWREARECLYVAPDEGKEDVKGVYWYNNKL